MNSTEELSNDRATLIRALTAASINAAKRSTDLGPNNVLNWRVRGSIYREVIPYIGGADQFAKESCEKAIELYEEALRKVRKAKVQYENEPPKIDVNDAKVISEILCPAKLHMYHSPIRQGRRNQSALILLAEFKAGTPIT